MAAATIDAIGLVGDVLGIVGFIKDLIPPAPEAVGAAVRIKAGRDTAVSSNLGGEISGVYGFDLHNAYLGKSGGVKVENGDVQTVTVGQKIGGVRSDFISVANGNDATCIAWIAVKQRDETVGGAWTGDIGAQCGQMWFYSEQLAGYIKGTDADGKETKTEYKPRCSWLDGDHTNDINMAAMKFRVTAYGEEVADTVKSQDNACKFTTYDKDNGPIKRAPGGADPLPPVKRAIPGTMPTYQNSSMPITNSTGSFPSFDGQLITSDFHSHTAQALCESKTSAGPDFVGSDGMFCDMKTKKLSPLCSSQNVEGCIEVNAKEKTVVKRSIIARREVGVVHKTYNDVTAWQ